MNTDRTEDKGADRSGLERYQMMNETEKDAEIEKAVLRLQKRIQEIMYLLGTETSSASPRDKTENERADLR